MKDRIIELLDALENIGQIAFVSPTTDKYIMLRNNAERLLLLTADIKSEKDIKRFDICKGIVTETDICTFFNKCPKDRPYYIIWENAQNFTQEALSCALHKTDELKFKSVYVINHTESLLTTAIPVFMKNRINLYIFDEDEIDSFREELYRHFTIFRSTNYNLNLPNLPRLWIRPLWSERRSIEVLSKYSEKLGYKLSSAFFQELFKLASTIECDAEQWYKNIRFSIRNAQRFLNELLSEPRTFTEFETIFHSEYTNVLCSEISSDKLNKYKNDEKTINNIKKLYGLYRESSYDKAGFIIALMNKKYGFGYDVNTFNNKKEENNMKITGVYSNEKKGRTTIKFDDGRVVSVQCDEEDKFDAHKGIAMALAKAAFGSKVLQECLSSYSKQKSGKENKKAKKARKAKAKAKKEESSPSSKKKDSGKNGHVVLADRYRTLKEEEK